MSRIVIGNIDGLPNIDVGTEYGVIVLGKINLGMGTIEDFVDITVYEGKKYFLISHHHKNSPLSYSCLNPEENFIDKGRLVPDNIRAFFIPSSHGEHISNLEKISSRVSNLPSPDYCKVLTELGVPISKFS